MSAIIGWLSSKAVGIGIGAIIPIAFMVGKKYIPNLIAKFVSKNLDKGFNDIELIKDEKEKELIRGIALSLVRYAEYKIPDKDAGKEKYKLVAEKLVYILPFLKGQEEKISDLIENAVFAMDNELKKRI